MKKIFIAVLSLWFAFAVAQTRFFVNKKDGTKVEFYISDVDSISFLEPIVPEHEYVDLGLPSGTLWAIYNVGAEMPDEYGDYFAWGETKPKDQYDWSTYELCKGTMNTLNKYNNDPDYGSVDKYTTILPEDDAATVNWGEGWRLPTKEELDELIANCKWTKTIYRKVSGFEGEGPNGNTIFFPFTGIVYGDATPKSPVYDGSRGFYLQSTLNETYPPYSYYLSLDTSVDCFDGKFSRDCGFSVRAVKTTTSVKK